MNSQTPGFAGTKWCAFSQFEACRGLQSFNADCANHIAVASEWGMLELGQAFVDQIKRALVTLVVIRAVMTHTVVFLVVSHSRLLQSCAQQAGLYIFT